VLNALCLKYLFLSCQLLIAEVKETTLEALKTHTKMALLNGLEFKDNTLNIN